MELENSVTPGLADLSRYYDTLAQGHRDERAQQEGYLQTRELVMNFIEPRLTKVLDIGCGVGPTTKELAQLGYHVTAIDPSMENIKAAHENISTLPPAVRARVKFFNQTLESSLFPAGSFSQVICLGVLEHIAQPEKFLAEVHRVLTPGGVCIFQTPNARAYGARVNSLKSQINQMLGRDQKTGYLRQYKDPLKLFEMATDLGFEVADYEFSHHYFYPMNRFAPEFSKKLNQKLNQRRPLFGRWRLGSNIVFKLEKF